MFSFGETLLRPYTHSILYTLRVSMHRVYFVMEAGRSVIWHKQVSSCRCGQSCPTTVSAIQSTVGTDDMASFVLRGGRDALIVFMKLSRWINRHKDMKDWIES